MSTGSLENKFRGYNWCSLLKEELAKDKFFDAGTLLVKGVKSFSNKFSPRIDKGCFQNLFKYEYYKRSKEDALNFIVNSGLVKDKEDAEEFIETFKNRDVEYLITGQRTGEFFRLIETKNVDGRPIYLTDTDKFYFNYLMD